MQAIAAGLAIKIECWDHDTFGKNDVLAATHVLLRPLLQLGVDGCPPTADFEKEMYHEGEVVIGHDGKHMSLVVSISVLEQTDRTQVWKKPTLAKSLFQADGGLIIDGDTISETESQPESPGGLPETRVGESLYSSTSSVGPDGLSDPTAGQTNGRSSFNSSFVSSCRDLGSLWKAQVCMPESLI